MNEEERLIIEQHKVDATKVLLQLDTMKCNIGGGEIDWNSIIMYRKDCVNAFLEHLNKTTT